MKSGHIYILSNPALPPNCLKIGLTQKSPVERAKELSRSTAIPHDFKLLHAQPVSNVITSEKRLHLVLDDKRLSMKKEFFQVTPTLAAATAKIIAEFESEDTTIFPSVHVHADLCGAHYYPDRGIVFKKLINTMMAATVNNSALDMLLGAQEKIVDGFLSITEIQEQSIHHKDTTVRTLTRLRDQWREVHAKNFQRVVVEKVFDAFYYRNGHIGWKFSAQMRQKFFNFKLLGPGYVE